MSEFAPEQRQNQGSHLVRPRKPDRSLPQQVSAGGSILAQRETLGNRASQYFAQSCSLALPGSVACPFGGVCHACPVQVQTKLKIGQPDDKYEQEADRVADLIMTISEPPNHSDRAMFDTAPLPGNSAVKENDGSDTIRCMTEDERLGEVLEEIIGGECEASAVQVDDKARQLQEEEILRQLAKIRREEERRRIIELLDNPPWIQRSLNRAEQTTSQVPAVMSTAVDLHPILHTTSSQTSGHPLSDSDRGFFESRLGCDLSYVRVHNDGQAADMARCLNARAFTIGSDIFFGTDRLESQTERSKRLLAHELVHTIQQSGTRAPTARTWNNLDTMSRIQERRVQRDYVFEGAPIDIMSGQRVGRALLPIPSAITPCSVATEDYERVHYPNLQYVFAQNRNSHVWWMDGIRPDGSQYRYILLFDLSTGICHQTQFPLQSSSAPIPTTGHGAGEGSVERGPLVEEEVWGPRIHIWDDSRLEGSVVNVYQRHDGTVTIQVWPPDSDVECVYRLVSESHRTIAGDGSEYGLIDEEGRFLDPGAPPPHYSCMNRHFGDDYEQIFGPP